VRCRTMAWFCGGLSATDSSLMDCYPLFTVEHLYSTRSQSNVQLMAYKAVGDAVQVVADHNVIVYVRSRILPFGEHTVCLRKWLERRPIYLLIHVPARSVHLLKRSVAQYVQLRPDDAVEPSDV